MFRLRKLANGSDEANSLLTKVGFAFRGLAFVPLLGLLVFVPPFRCAGTSCEPADIATSSLTLSLVLGFVAAAIWVWFAFSRLYTSGATKLFAEPSSNERTLLIASVALAVAALVLMLVGQPVDAELSAGRNPPG